MKALCREVAALPTVPRSGSFGAAIAGAGGAVVGLVIGLQTYAPTAWFAMIEVGLPAALCGASAGLVVGWLLTGWRRVRH